MKPQVEHTLHNDLEDGEIIRRITLKVSHLFSMKEKQRQVMGDFLNSEVLNVNAPGQSVVRYNLTYQLGIIGAFTGKVFVNLDMALAEKITGVLFGTIGEVPREDVDAATQELLNIFGGHLATAFNEMGIDIDITTPEPTDEDFLQAKEGRRILFRFSSDGSILQFLLVLKRRNPEEI